MSDDSEFDANFDGNKTNKDQFRDTRRSAGANSPAATNLPAPNRQAARVLAATLGAEAYIRIIRQMIHDDSEMLKVYIDEYDRIIAMIDPQDPIEAMMAIQAAVMHARLLFLNYFAPKQTTVATMESINQAAGRLADVTRRHLNSLADYRNPNRRRFTAVRQANIASQQIVSNLPAVAAPPNPLELEQTISRLLAEKGILPHESDPRRPVPQTAQTPLPPLPGRPDIAPTPRPPEPTLDPFHRPADGVGQKTIEPKPPDPRRLLP